MCRLLQMHVVGIVTQSMFISLISQNIARLGSLRQLRVRDMSEQLRREVVSVNNKTLALEAFRSAGFRCQKNDVISRCLDRRLMEAKGLSGLAVVDEQGVLLDTLSARDLRGIGVDADKYHRLWYEVDFFKEVTRQDFKQQA